MSWDLYRTFLEVKRCGSLSGAARKLGSTHPTVSRQLDALETLLGARLFTRSTQGLIPTALAERIGPDVEAMAARAHAIRRTVAIKSDKIAGHVRISASHVMATEVLPRMLLSLRARHPLLGFELAVSDEQADVLRRDVDVAIRMARPSTGGLLARRVGTVGVGLYARADWLAQQEAPDRIEDLLREGTLVAQDRRGSFASALGLPVTEVQAATVLRSDDDLAQLAAVRAGLGIGAVQVPLASRDKTLQRVLPSFGIQLEVWLVTHPDLQKVPAIRAVLDGLHEGLDRYVRSGTPRHAAGSSAGGANLTSST